MVQVQSPPQTQTFVKTANPITITATATKTATVTATETVVQAQQSNNPQKVVVTATIGGDQQHQLIIIIIIIIHLKHSLVKDIASFVNKMGLIEWQKKILVQQVLAPSMNVVDKN